MDSKKLYQPRSVIACPQCGAIQMRVETLHLARIKCKRCGFDLGAEIGPWADVVRDRVEKYNAEPHPKKANQDDPHKPTP